MDKFFYIFCQYLLRRRELEKQYNLCMSDRDYSFYEDQHKQKVSCTAESPDLDFFLASVTKAGKETSGKFRLFFSIRS